MCKTGSNIDSADADQDKNSDQGQDREDHVNKNLTLKLDWVLGDDPSQVAIPCSPPPRVDMPLDIPSTVPEVPEFALGSILENEEASSARETLRRPKIGTWPRMRRLLYSGFQSSEVESTGIDNGHDASKTSVDTLESGLPRSSLTQGTQTECSMAVVNATAQEGRLIETLLRLVSSNDCVSALTVAVAD